MKKYAFLLLLPLLMAGGGDGGPEQKPITVVESPDVTVEIIEGDGIGWTTIIVTAITTVGGLIGAYITATGQWTAEGRKERKTKKRMKKEQGDFAKKESEK